MDEERTAERSEVWDDVEPRRADYEPEGADPRTGLWPTLKRTGLEFMEDNMTDWAAALTYYGLLSLFPALIALVSLLGLFGDPVTTTRQITDVVTELGPSTAADTFAGPIESITSNRSSAGILFFVGLGVALWSASGYVGAFSRASNVAWETPEGRSFFKLRPLQILITLVMVIMLAAICLALVLTGPVVEAVGRLDRGRRDGAYGLGDRQVAGLVGGHDRDLLAALLRRPQRQPAGLSLDHPGEHRRGLCVAVGLGAVCLLRLQLRLL